MSPMSSEWDSVPVLRQKRTGFMPENMASNSILTMASSQHSSLLSSMSIGNERQEEQDFFFFFFLCFELFSLLSEL